MRDTALVLHHTSREYTDRDGQPRLFAECTVVTARTADDHGNPVATFRLNADTNRKMATIQLPAFVELIFSTRLYQGRTELSIADIGRSHPVDLPTLPSSKP